MRRITAVSLAAVLAAVTFVLQALPPCDVQGGLLAQAPAVPVAETRHGQTRTRVVAGDPYRAEVVIWSRAGGMTQQAVYPDGHAGTYTLAAPSGKTLTLPRAQPTFGNGVLN